MIDKVDAEKTMYLYIEQNKAGKSIIMPNVPFLLHHKDNKIRLVFFNKIEMDKQPGQEALLVLDYGNDPTPTCAGQVHSLGYYLMRITFKGEIVSLDPLTIDGNRADLVQYFNRPQRLLYSENKSKSFNFPDLGENPEFVKFIYVPESNWGPVHSFSVVWNETNCIYAEDSIDLRSFYSNVNLLEAKEINQEEAMNYLKERVKLDARHYL